MPNEVIPQLWVGDYTDACRWDRGPRLNVLESHPSDSYVRTPQDRWLPILRYGKDNASDFWAHPPALDEAANWIDTQLRLGETVLVHCGAGIERSPLTAAWFLWKKRGYSDLNAAYAAVVRARPQTQRRDHWVSGVVGVFHG